MQGRPGLVPAFALVVIDLDGNLIANDCTDARRDCAWPRVEEMHFSNVSSFAQLVHVVANLSQDCMDSCIEPVLVWRSEPGLNPTTPTSGNRPLVRHSAVSSATWAFS